MTMAQQLVSGVLPLTMTGPEAVREMEDRMIPQPIAGPRSAGEMVDGMIPQPIAGPRSAWRDGSWGSPSIHD